MKHPAYVYIITVLAGLAACAWLVAFILHLQLQQLQ